MNLLLTNYTSLKKHVHIGEKKTFFSIFACYESRFCFITRSCYNFVLLCLLLTCLRFLKRDGTGLKFLLWLQSEIGMP